MVEYPEIGTTTLKIMLPIPAHLWNWVVCSHSNQKVNWTLATHSWCLPLPLDQTSVMVSCIYFFFGCILVLKSFLRVTIATGECWGREDVTLSVNVRRMLLIELHISTQWIYTVFNKRQSLQQFILLLSFGWALAIFIPSHHSNFMKHT